MNQPTGPDLARTRVHGSVRNAAIALGLATLLLAHVFEPLVRSTHILVYHWSGPSSALFGPPAAELGALSVFLFFLLMSAQRLTPWRSLVWSGIILFLPRVIFHEIQRIWPGTTPLWFRLPPIWLELLAFPVLAVFWTRYTKQRETVIEAASVVLAFTALSSVFILAQFFFFWWKARDLNQPLPLHRPIAIAQIPSGPKTRIIWVLMDELSYRQVYGHRFASLQLPAFDALAAQSAVFTQVSPTANFTEDALPSLISGAQITTVRSTSDGMLETRSAAHSPWHPFDERQSVFQDADNAGYNTAVVGWYNPYCRILRDVLNDCYWADDYAASNGLLPDRSFKVNLIDSAAQALYVPLFGPFLQWLHPSRRPAEDKNASFHIEDFRDLRAVSNQALLDPSFTFTFIHLPIPHPDGIYNRQTQRLTTVPTTYIDNLALADRYLAHMRDLLKSSGQWDSSVVILMGDHGWRTTLVWRGTVDWTPEEEKASLGGTFDPRPAYIVKLAGENQGIRIDSRFNAIRTRALIDAIMAGKVQTTSDLQQWVAGPPASATRYVAALQ